MLTHQRKKNEKNSFHSKKINFHESFSFYNLKEVLSFVYLEYDIKLNLMVQLKSCSVRNVEYPLPLLPGPL